MKASCIFRVHDPSWWRGRSNPRAKISEKIRWALKSDLGEKRGHDDDKIFSGGGRESRVKELVRGRTRVCSQGGQPGVCSNSDAQDRGRKKGVLED